MLGQYYLRKALRVLWALVRLPAFTLLVILAPLVRFLLGSLALLGVLMALCWKLVGPVDFPFIPMLAGAIGCRLALAGYEGVLTPAKPITRRKYDWKTPPRQRDIRAQPAQARQLQPVRDLNWLP